MQKVIVTGGMGYIGSHTVVELIDHNYEPIIFDNLSNSEESVLDNIAKITGKSVQFENVDLSNEKETYAVFEKHKDSIGVIHFAALKAVGESVEKPTEYYKNNIFSLINVLTGVSKNNISNFIFSSSCTVYGQPDQLPVNENTPFKVAESPYGRTKQIGEEIVASNSKVNADSLNSISLRYFNPIGAHISGELGELPLGKPSNLMPCITQTAAGVRDELLVYGNDYDTVDGTAIRDYIHVVDLANAHVFALKRLIEKKNADAYEVFNLGTGKGFSVMEVIQSFERTSSLKLNYKMETRRPGDIEQIYADTTKSEQVLGWKTKLTLDDMTRSAWQWEKKIRNL